MISLSHVFWLGVIASGAIAIQFVHFAWFMSWSDRQTDGLNYYGRSAAERARFQQRIRRHAIMLSPIRWLLSRCGKFQFASGTFHHRGVPGPKAGSCSMQSFRAAEDFRPGRDDVFVVTQMRSGTTWMQHLVFQVLSRGTRDLAREDVCLNAISPWLESHKSVSLEEAPKVGAPGSARRIVKTHLPASLCPFHDEAKYIYVVRHPVSCFASCVDFVHSNLRGFEPSLDACLEWFLSKDQMWWGTWWDHLRGWHAHAEDADNVLIVQFEQMKADLPAVIRQVANFLEVDDLSEQALQAIQERCGFEYMQQNATVFEMHPPHVLQVPGRFFVSGRTVRDSQLPLGIQDRIRDACWKANLDGRLPLHSLYPDLVPPDAQVESPEVTLDPISV